MGDGADYLQDREEALREMHYDGTCDEFCPICWAEYEREQKVIKQFPKLD